IPPYIFFLILSIFCVFIFILKNFVYFDKIKTNSGGAPTSLARKIAVAKKQAAKARAGKNSFPQTPFLFARPSVQFRSKWVRIWSNKCTIISAASREAAFFLRLFSKKWYYIVIRTWKTF